MPASSHITVDMPIADGATSAYQCDIQLTARTPTSSRTAASSTNDTSGEGKAVIQGETIQSPTSVPSPPDPCGTTTPGDDGEATAQPRAVSFFQSRLPTPVEDKGGGLILQKTVRFPGEQ